MNKKAKHSFAAKFAAVAALYLTSFLCLASAVGSIVMLKYDFYGSATSDIELKKTAFRMMIDDRADDVFNNYYELVRERDSVSNTYSSYSLEKKIAGYQSQYSPANSNFFFILMNLNENGKIVLSNYVDQDYLIRSARVFYVNNRAAPFGVNPSTQYTMECYVSSSLRGNDDFVTASRIIDGIFDLRYATAGLFILSFIISVLLFSYIIGAVGDIGDNGVTVPRGINRIPLDLFLIIVVAIAIATATLLSKTYHFYNLTYAVAFAVAAAAIVYVFVILLCITLAIRAKAGTLWQNTLLRRIYSACGYFISNLPVMWKAAVAVALITALELVFLIVGRYRYTLLAEFWTVEKIVLIPFVILASINMNHIQKGAHVIAGGNLDYQISTKYMLHDFKRYAEDLNSISEGMSRAVEEGIKSEHMKTELITNVSHDIKTPLTSIVSYVGLLKKENLQNEAAAGYLEVLERQSSRLKKLIDDLVEASRASTGNITADMEKTSVGILLTQAVGEYEDKLGQCGLELILNQPEDDVFILADGRLLWRVLDNLMGNICKYAMPNTRVYVDLTASAERVYFTFRNISRDELKKTPGEMLDRFVRGDVSRSTEGSGLGLSIAKSLVELQKGKLELFVDGDLFKVAISFDRLPD